MKRLVTADTITAAAARGERRVGAPTRECIVTPEAWTKAAALGVTIDQSASAKRDGGCERSRDASGVTVVRGKSVELGRFTGAGADKNIGLLDLITAKDNSPMTAGIMEWSAADSFAWKLDYDEIDYVLEGVLHVRIDGRVIEAQAGDVVHIPKGSSIVFGTPSRARVFYVTYPANWAVGAS